MKDAELVAGFVDLYHNRRAPWTQVFWRGHQVAKCPMDLWVYQEILFETKPELLIETGSNIGGSAYFFASIFDMIGAGQVITVDKDAYPNQPVHPRIGYLTGDSVERDVVVAIRSAAEGQKSVMVVLDSLHTFEHVAMELAAYGNLVTPGCYLVVEDTAVDESWRKPAAKAAARDFLLAHSDFAIDETREKHMMTLNPGGWIRRKG